MRWGLAGLFVWLLSPSAPPIRFREVARQAGLVFTLDNAATPEKHMIETMAGGVAVFDYNNDGRPDVFFTGAAAGNRLFRNDGNLRFTDVTAEAGVAGSGYSMGAAAADFDNDGFVDLFVAGVNRNLLYRNLGNGRFEDVTARAGNRERPLGRRRRLAGLRPRRPARPVHHALFEVARRRALLRRSPPRPASLPQRAAG